MNQETIDNIHKNAKSLIDDMNQSQKDIQSMESTMMKPNLNTYQNSAKAKTIKYIDDFVNNGNIFATLDKDKQEAILSLKYIKASKIPNSCESLDDLDKLSIHFNSKADKAQREKYAPLFNITKEHPNIKLEVEKDKQQRIEYIKAFEHKAKKDLYYIAITQENDNIKITGIPTTQISQIVKDIVRSKRIMLIEVAENLGTISNSAEPNTNISKSQLSNETIPKDSTKSQEQKDSNSKSNESNKSNTTTHKRRKP